MTCRASESCAALRPTPQSKPVTTGSRIRQFKPSSANFVLLCEPSHAAPLRKQGLFALPRMSLVSALAMTQETDNTAANPPQMNRQMQRFDDDK